MSNYITMSNKGVQMHKRLKNYEKAIKLLDDNVEEALRVLIDGMRATTEDGRPDKWYRLSCASVLIKKVIPDRKVKEPNEDDVKKPEIIDKRTVIMNIVNMLDEVGFEELRRRSESGNYSLPKFDGGRKREKESNMEETAGGSS